MEADAPDFFAAPLALLQRDHPVLDLVDLVADQDDGDVADSVFRAAQSTSSLVVVDEELEAVALVERALVRHGVHQDERFGPADVGFEGQTLALLQEKEQVTTTRRKLADNCLCFPTRNSIIPFSEVINLRYSTYPLILHLERLSICNIRLRGDLSRNLFLCRLTRHNSRLCKFTNHFTTAPLLFFNCTLLDLLLLRPAEIAS